MNDAAPVGAPRDWLTAPNCDQFARVSLTILDFLDAINKAKKQGGYLDLAMAVNLFLSNLTTLLNLNNLFVSETGMDAFSNSRLKVTN